MTVSKVASSRILPRFARDRRGNVAMMFGLMLLPILGSVALAIDFGNIMTARTKGQMAADAAALQASGVARELIRNSDGSDATVNAAIAEGKKRGDALFAAHAVQAGLKTYTINTVVTKKDLTVSATADFSVTTNAFLSKVFSYSGFSAKGSAVSASSLPAYSDVYLALDVSGSMGIAATNAEMVKLFNARGRRTDGSTAPLSCVFGCHAVETHAGWAESFSAIAVKNNVRLRIDVLRDAVKSMISTASADAESAPIYRIALYGLGASPDASIWALNEISGLSGNWSQLRSAADKIDIATPPPNAPQKQNSYLNEQMNWAATLLPISYDGTSQLKSRKYVFLITDGARDVPPEFGSCVRPAVGAGRCVNGIDPATCKAMKNKGITVGVLYTTYIPILNDPANPASGLDYWYQEEMVATGAVAKLQPSLKECASDGWFYEASDADGIKTAMAKMFAQTTQAPTLTR